MEDVEVDIWHPHLSFPGHGAGRSSCCWRPVAVHWILCRFCEGSSLVRLWDGQAWCQIQSIRPPKSLRSEGWGTRLSTLHLQLGVKCSIKCDQLLFLIRCDKQLWHLHQYCFFIYHHHTWRCFQDLVISLSKIVKSIKLGETMCVLPSLYLHWNQFFKLE